MITLTNEQFHSLMKRAKTKRDTQRVQCVALHAIQKLYSEDIAPIVGMSAVSVRRVWIAFKAKGEEILFDEKRGGRRYEHLDVTQEKAFLQPFIKKASAGGVINIKVIHSALEKKVGKTIPSSTTYAMLHRQGWRKIAPRAHHPKGNPIAREKFTASFPPHRQTSNTGSRAQGTKASLDV